jgi:membrane-bound hydrogenase subunit alpha
MGMRRNPVQILHLSERVCGICGIVHAMTFARAVEQIAEIDVPPRADYIRVILFELERIQSHLLWAGVAAHELGFDSLFYLAWEGGGSSRLDIIENLCGTRVNYAIIQIGGVRRDISPAQEKEIEAQELYRRLSRTVMDEVARDMFRQLSKVEKRLKKPKSLLTLMRYLH